MFQLTINVLKMVISSGLTAQPTKSSTGRRGNLRRGAAAVELAFVAPFILFLVFGTVEFARMVMIKQVLTSAARTGCRQASLATTLDQQSCDTVVRERVKGSIADYADPEIVRVSVTPEFTAPLDTGTEITVVVEIDCAAVSWFPPSVFADAKIRGSSSTKRE